MSLDFIHQFVPAENGDPVTLLLLHGTGGNEHDLLALGRSISETAALLSPRGKVLENGMPRFFRRLAEGVFDEEDLVRRTHELAEFADSACEHYARPRERVIAVGFSNGANIAASVLLLSPKTLLGAVLMRAMVPLDPTSPPALSGRHVLITSGKADPIVPVANPERLAAMLRDAGADVTLRWYDAGHSLTRQELADAKQWLAELRVATPG